MYDFFISEMEHSNYPTSQYYYSPDVCYPEYPWNISDISEERNYIYEMVRNSFAGLQMDFKNFGTKHWNPLGEIITQGDTVLIKPNWVMHFNKNKKVTKNALECLITHPSVLRAVIDYCIIALNGTGKMIIGDAPMQGCDLDKLIEHSGYKKVFSFYNNHSIPVHPVDFRQYAALIDSSKVIHGRKYNNNAAIEVELGVKSKLIFSNSKNKRFKVSDYDEILTNTFHNNEKHTYVISHEVLSADVILNISKPKCHRLAGITAALKNFVGITHNKASLPHRTVGSKKNGGDEYLNNSITKKIIGNILDNKIKFENNNNYIFAFILRYFYGLLYHYMKATSKDKYLIGSWYGNDTIWRTILDLYFILLYADKNGKIQDDRQRKVFNIADMIISGEGNGPVGPEPKYVGVIISGYDSVMLDRLICEIMGFNYLNIPSVFNSVNDPTINTRKMSNYLIGSNIEKYNNKYIDELHFLKEWQFKPHESWIGHIEK